MILSNDRGALHFWAEARSLAAHFPIETPS